VRLVGTPHADDRIWPAPVRRALVIEFSAFAIYALVWWATQGKPSSAVQLALLAINAAALGLHPKCLVHAVGIDGHQVRSAARFKPLTTDSNDSRRRSPCRRSPSCETAASISAGTANCAA
jgi:hypothetical protein